MSDTTPNREPVATTSADRIAGRLAALRDLIPEAFAEGRVDFDALRAALGDVVDDRPERYTFSWAGKRDAIRLLQTPTRATLVPAPEESLDWETTGHAFIEGDNLEVLKVLAKAYFGRVKLIYIDPPYNTGNEFIYPDNYADPLETYLRLTGQLDGDGNATSSRLEKSGRYHSAWLSMMYPRLFLARQLLREDGVIFVSIDDHEVHNLRLLMNEVFGEENFVATIIWQKVYAPKNTARHFSEDHDYVLVYARNAEVWTPNLLPRTEEADSLYRNPDNDRRGPWMSDNLTARNYYSEGRYEVTSPSGKKFRPPIGTYWRVKYEKFLELDRDGRIWWGPTGDNMPRLKRFRSEVKEGIVPQTLWTYGEVGHTQEAKKELLECVAFENTDNVLDTVKPSRLIQRIVQLATSPTEPDLVLDFFAGSASTAHGVLRQNRADGGNRRYLMVQLPELLPEPETRLRTIADIAKERLRHVAAVFAAEREGRLDLDTRDAPEDLGFRVFKLAPSNYKVWTGVGADEPEAYVRQIELHTDPLADGWTPEGVLWEVALKEAGIGLHARLERLEVGGATVYRLTDPDTGQVVHACLDETLPPDLAATLGLGREDLFVCRDAALTDELAANLALQCRLKTV